MQNLVNELVLGYTQSKFEEKYLEKKIRKIGRMSGGITKDQVIEKLAEAII